MHQLIAAYLFQTNICQLNGLGKLFIDTAAAEPDFNNKKIDAPVNSILFEQNELSSNELALYIARTIHCDELEATSALDHFCDNIKNKISANVTAHLQGVGSFYTDSSGNLKFDQERLPSFFFQGVNAKRVIHPQAEHPILVGDKESTNTLMTEYFNEVPVKNDYWWIWAIALGLIAIGIIIIYFYHSNNSSLFGNAAPY